MVIALYIIAGLFLLLASGEALVKGSVSLAERFGISHAVIGLTVVALGTSMPELVVSITSALQDHTDMAIGNIIGSNISNIALILGISAMIYPITIHHKMIKRELPILVLVTLIFAGLCYGGIIGILQGAILLTLLLAYITFIIRSTKNAPKEAAKIAQDIAQDIPSSTSSLPKAIAYTTVGIIFLAIGANTLITGSLMLAAKFNIPETIISVTILAIGSSLPELATSAVAAYRKHTDIVMANIIGSNLINILFAISIPALITPLHVNPDYLSVDVKFMVLLTILLAAILLAKKQINRLTGGLFFASFVVYIIYLTSQI